MLSKQDDSEDDSSDDGDFEEVNIGGYKRRVDIKQGGTFSRNELLSLEIKACVKALVDSAKTKLPFKRNGL